MNILGISAGFHDAAATVISPEGSNYSNHKVPSSTASNNVEKYDDMQMDDE